MLHRQVDRMQRMVEDLLTSSRMRSGALTCRPRTVDLGEEIPRLVAPSLLEGVDLDTEALTGCRVRFDPDHLAQVLTNLLANAARYGEPPVKVTAERHDDRVELSVADHGEGIAREAVPELFHRYEHGGDTAGLGLGLHIVRQLTERNGGTVVYRDHEPRGACFVLDLPAAEPTGPPSS